MSVGSLLRDLSAQGIALSVRGDRILVRAPKGAITDNLLERLREQKALIMQYLAAQAEKEADKQPCNHEGMHLPRRCFACGGGFWWVSIHGNGVCLTCHPPARADLVLEMISPDRSGVGE